MQKIELSKLTTTELKALAFENQVANEQIQQTISLIMKELSKRPTELVVKEGSEAEVKAEVKEEKKDDPTV